MNEIRTTVSTIYALTHQPMAYNPEFARLTGSVPAGVFLSYIIHWIGKGHDDNGGWIFKSQPEIADATGLHPDAQRRARKKLVSLGILMEKRQDTPAKLYYNIDLNRLLELIDNASQMSHNATSRSGETPYQVHLKTPDLSYKEKQENINRKNSPLLKNVFQLLESLFGLTITAYIAEQVTAAIDEHGADTVRDAITLAAENNKRNWNYVAGILRNWKYNGRSDLPKHNAPAAKNAPAKDLKPVKSDRIAMMQK